MNLGCNESSVNLQVNTLNVKQSSKLDLNGGKGVLSNSMTLGNGNDNGRIAFNKVRIQGGTSRSINVKGTMNVPSLKLFESDFPDCKQAGGKGGTMSWTPLKLKGASGSELYLACASGETTAEKTCAENPNQAKCCTSSQEWNGSRCVDKPKECSWTVVSDNYIVAPVGDIGLDDNCDENIDSKGAPSCCSRLSSSQTCMDVYPVQSMNYVDYYLTESSSWAECPGSSAPDYGLLSVTDKTYNGYNKTQYVKDHWAYYAARGNGSFDSKATYWGCYTENSYSGQFSEIVFKAVYKQAVYKCQ